MKELHLQERAVKNLVKFQMEEQGCWGDDLESIRLMQPHLYQWIDLLGLKEFAKSVEGEKE